MLDGVGQCGIFARQGDRRCPIGCVDGRGEISGLGQRGGKGIESVHFFALGKLDRLGCEFYSPASIADRPIRTGRQNPSYLPQLLGIVGRQMDGLVEMCHGTRRPPERAQHQAQLEVSPGATRPNVHGSLQVGKSLLELPLGAQRSSQNDGRLDGFDGVGALAENLLTARDCFFYLAASQEGVGQSDLCFQTVGNEPQGLAPRGDGLVAPSRASQRDGQARMTGHAGWEKTDGLL